MVRAGGNLKGRGDFILIRTTLAATCLSLVLGTSAYAQGGFEGLDLTGGEEKKEEKTEEAKPDAAAATEATPSTPQATQVPVEGESPQADGSTLTQGERDVTQEDRVKSVQRKLYIKKYRFELAPYVVVTINDPYYLKWGGAVRGAFYLADTLAISARFTLMQTLPTDDVRVAKRAFQSRIFYSVPIWSVMADFEWSPFYGKVSFLNSILHFDGYVIGGAGVVYTETSSLPNRGVNVAADLGFGFRFVAKDFLAVNAALINIAYVDQPAGTSKATVQNMMMFHLGISLFIPFKSTYREAE